MLRLFKRSRQMSAEEEHHLELISSGAGAWGTLCDDSAAISEKIRHLGTLDGTEMIDHVELCELIQDDLIKLQRTLLEYKGIQRQMRDLF